MRTSNPALNDRVFQNAAAHGASGQTMTVQGTVNKTLILLGILVLTAAWLWSKVLQPAETPIFGEAAQAPSYVFPLMMGGAIGGFIFALITIFKKEWSSVTAPIYAALEGLFVGGISAIYEYQFPGIVVNAVGLTFGTLFCLLMAYKSGLVQVTQKFRLGVIAATGAVCLIYFVNIIMSFFGASIPGIHSAGTFGIGFSLVVVTIAALNLVLDFDFIERGAHANLPKHMEWYGAFGLMVTLIWLYIEILRLLSKLRRR